MLNAGCTYLQQPLLKAGMRRSYTVLKHAKIAREKAYKSLSTVKVRKKKRKHISSFILFFKHKSLEIPKEVPHDNRRKMISQMWKEVSARERSKYAELARKMREQGKIRHLVITDAENRMQVFVWHSWFDSR